MAKEKMKPIRNKTHARNKNIDRYDLQALVKTIPNLTNYIQPNVKGEDTIDFKNPVAIKTLNTALLKYYYGIEYWVFPDTFICPSIPNKADYVHHMADVLMESNFGTLPQGNKITCFDLGMGASCIYPIIGITEYDWNFVGSDIDEKSIIAAQAIVNKNKVLKNKMECKIQANPKDFFYSIIDKETKVDLAICNPPLYANLKDAQTETQKKSAPFTVAEIGDEIIYEGGETGFLQRYVKESKKFSENCFWFSALVHKSSNQKGMVEFLDELGATQTKAIPMGLGNKASQIIAWTFLNKTAQVAWKKERWDIKQA
ncbi:23S rRNA (adenine(1618)-N(6))-methyltransferase RlmF [Wenyingzhuangia sp. 2_MG-2023]|uniref:23S rRNA (adenine(1618)-N(6))-methyltransferase RlmF n=1 Tax=Wenyingzhuangia sp. 2_MG-2023 TaxID=3062639 RepID=UPI0026E41E28|nr:23S rRNA (adenine(1618)-N(6))-methyltransferase RlmF [Wenyingzhuangia sp. 2_MG-2023]MDO6738484.1 23S rRNA (adenine(1618)-N(6))-methyltransferase RlmF [Wenyingzhuangia sp. 2_MG-2023]